MILLRSVWSGIDRFLAAILLTVGFAAVMPARGSPAGDGITLRVVRVSKPASGALPAGEPTGLRLSATSQAWPPTT
jgi:hypothetical protein